MTLYLIEFSSQKEYLIAIFKYGHIFYPRKLKFYEIMIMFMVSDSGHGTWKAVALRKLIKQNCYIVIKYGLCTAFATRPSKQAPIHSKKGAPSIRKNVPLS